MTFLLELKLLNKWCVNESNIKTDFRQFICIFQISAETVLADLGEIWYPDSL